MDAFLSPWLLGFFEAATFWKVFMQCTLTEKFFMILTAILPLLAIIRLKGIIKANRKKKKLAKDLTALVDKYGNYHTFRFDPESPSYKEILSVLKESGIISTADIYLFEKGSFMPATPHLGMPSPSQYRQIMFEQIIDWAIIQTRH